MISTEVVAKTKYEIRGIAIEELLIKAKISSIIESDSSKYKNTTSVNKNVVAKIDHNEHKDVLLNKKLSKH